MMNLESLKASIAAFGSERARLEKKLEKLRQQYELTENAPLPRDDFVQMMHECVDAQADSYGDKVRRTLLNFRTKINLDPSSTRLPWFGAVGVGGDNAKVEVDALLYFFRPALKDAIRDTIESVTEWGESGPPRAERPAALAKLDREIATVERELREMKDAARAAGVRVDG